MKNMKLAGLIATAGVLTGVALGLPANKQDGELYASEEKFFLEARLEAYEGDKLVFEKEIIDSVPRDNR